MQREVSSLFLSGIVVYLFFLLLQANETGSSNAMELEVAKRSFNFLKRMGLSVATFISDRHRESQSGSGKTSLTPLTILISGMWLGP